MHAIFLSQKQKLILAVILLLIGFMGLGGFTMVSLNQINNQTTKSSELTSSTASLRYTEASLLKLALKMSSLIANDVSQARSDLKKIQQLILSSAPLLNKVGLSNEYDSLSSNLNVFESVFEPWVVLKSDIGFDVNSGKLGLLKSLATTIESKIKETGMVTLDSDFQNMVKMQQNYLLNPSANTKKLFNRSMFSFINISNNYAMLELYEKEMDGYKKTFAVISESLVQLNQLEQSLFKAQDNALDAIDALATRLDNKAVEYQTLSSETAQSAKVSVLIACLLLALITVSIFVVLSLNITAAFSKITNILEAMSGGDLTKRLEISDNDKDEFNHLALAANQTCENLGHLIDKVQQSSQALSNNAAKLNTIVDGVVDSQSEVINQTHILASATEEVSATAQGVSDNLSMVSEVSQQASQAAVLGESVIGGAIKSIEEIGEILRLASKHVNELELASSKIDSVMEIITGVAEQTNLLALNAAIEAARAGDQGRGFAVVADEVRNLAVRTVTAVEEISGTIDSMKRESAEVIQYINQSEQSMINGQQQGHEAMDAIKNIIKKSDEANQQTIIISDSIKELALTSHSMADNMAQISSAMQSTDSSNEQLRSNSKEVDERSSLLNNDCKRFTI
ncbi:MAG: methyl-accepting chemotaxis protein [Aliivibrio sp.]|uniref:methyl-accepting chemotaxis protein n=1 Tax=Aliivibrio sp. TaxID=1872443 RepID=UPI001A3A6B09|nr:methyl-accepting chemotaxis protein [Aliivibrio sp.]